MSKGARGPTLQQLTEELVAFRDARDWRQFHTLKNLLLSLSLEAAEALEIAQWKSDEELDALLARGDEKLLARLEEECADVLLFLLLIAEKAGFDLAMAARDKIARNGEKYPAEKVRGRALKYTEID